MNCLHTLRGSLIGLIILSPLLLRTACTGGDHKVDPEAEPVVTTVQDGPVSLTMTASRRDLPFDAPLHLTIEAKSSDDTTLEISDYSQLIRDSGQQYEFSAIRKDRKEAVPTGDKGFLWTYVYELRFFVPGQFDLPPARLTYHPKTESADGGDPKELTTEPISLDVQSNDATAAAQKDLTKIETLPPKGLAEPWSVRSFAVIAAAVVATIVVLILFLMMRRKRAEEEVLVPAHEWFRAQVSKLVHDDLIGAGLVQEFHYRISDILRGYIGRRFGIQAREMTTEEFLSESTKSPRFPVFAAQELSPFLTACDMVKYARRKAGREEAEALLRTAGEFVERTRSHETSEGGSAPNRIPSEAAA